MKFQYKLQLLKSWKSKFTNQKGDEIEYSRASLLDDEGNTNEVTVDKGAEGIEGLKNTTGTATLELLPGRSTDGRVVLKLRLLAFTPDEE